LVVVARRIDENSAIRWVAVGVLTASLHVVDLAWFAAVELAEVGMRGTQ
jgi:hypothetical protein